MSGTCNMFIQKVQTERSLKQKGPISRSRFHPSKLHGYLVYLDGSYLPSNGSFSGVAVLLQALLSPEPASAIRAAYPRGKATSTANRVRLLSFADISNTPESNRYRRIFR
jgi:hypothetical protein